MYTRTQTTPVRIGNLTMGGSNNVIVQSMTNADPSDGVAVVEQALALQAVGCELVRIAVPNVKAATTVTRCRDACDIPIVADVHYNYDIAVAALHAGAHKVRINPGNMRDSTGNGLQTLARVANECGAALRIGVNIGSLHPGMERQYGRNADAMVYSAMHYVDELHSYGFGNIVLSLKATDVVETVAAYRKMATLTQHPLHIGVTHAGTAYGGLVRSAMGIGALLLDGIGDTIRVSLSAPPTDEVRAGYTMLDAAGIRHSFNVIACPTCGRCGGDVSAIATLIEDKLSDIRTPLTVAVMGCAVNGPGEARHADVGVAFHPNGKAALFAHGERLRDIEGDVTTALLDEIRRLQLQIQP